NAQRIATKRFAVGEKSGDLRNANRRPSRSSGRLHPGTGRGEESLHLARRTGSSNAIDLRGPAASRHTGRSNEPRESGSKDDGTDRQDRARDVSPTARRK